MSTRNVVWIAVVIALLLTGCKKDAQPAVWAQQGQASWYGHPYDGRLTASGETYDMEKMTAAHRTFPFGTVLLVTNLGNNQTVQVRINDRGPFVKDRVIDLSHAAAQTISMPGVANVGIKVISTPPTRAADVFAVQGFKPIMIPCNNEGTFRSTCMLGSSHSLVGLCSHSICMLKILGWNERNQLIGWQSWMVLGRVYTLERLAEKKHVGGSHQKRFLRNCGCLSWSVRSHVVINTHQAMLGLICIV